MSKVEIKVDVYPLKEKVYMIHKGRVRDGVVVKIVITETHYSKIDYSVRINEGMTTGTYEFDSKFVRLSKQELIDSL